MPTAARLHGAQPPIRLRRDGEERRGRPGSQETCLRPQAHKPSWKGVGSMLVSPRMPTVLAAALLSLLLLAAPPKAGTPATVTVRVEGTSNTLVPPTEPTTTNVPVVKDGNAAHVCS